MAFYADFKINKISWVKSRAWENLPDFQKSTLY